MADYCYVTIIFPGREPIKIVIEDEEFSSELVALQRTYSAKVKRGRRLNKAEAAHWDRVQSQQIAPRKGAVPARPLSADFGRGSGAPV